MEWDASAFMKIAIGIFFLVFGGGLAYALLRLAGTFNEFATAIRDISQEVVPILSRVQTTVDEVNSELEKIDEITGSVAGMTGRLESTTSAVQEAVGAPVKKFAGFAAGVGEGVSRFIADRRGRGYE